MLDVVFSILGDLSIYLKIFLIDLTTRHPKRTMLELSFDFITCFTSSLHTVGARTPCSSLDVAHKRHPAVCGTN